MEDNMAVDNHSDKMEAQEIQPNLNKVQNKSDCQSSNQTVEKKPDEHAQEMSELSLKKPEDPFKVPAMLKVKMSPSKLTARPADDCSLPGAATRADKSGEAEAGNLISGRDPQTSQTMPSSDGFLIPSNVAPQPPAAGGTRPSRGSAVPPSQAGSSAERGPAGSAVSAARGPAGSAVSAARGPAGSAVSAARAAAAYRPPAWSGCPPRPYTLEVVRGGRVVDTLALQDRACSVFGRLPDCDVRLEHPSISRHHAALVYRASGDDGHEEGYYLYDLGSTHGSMLNKMAIQPKVYCRMRVGHMCKFGSSTRFFVLQGPEEDREEESPLTVTELKELGQKREQERQERLEAIDDRETGTETGTGTETAAAQTSAADGISWGMAEDADEETDIQFNPFSLGEAQNEQLYLVDPKKTLRGWFEREGHELEYRTEELAGQRHICRVTLPLDSVDGRPPVAEAQQVGKKKEAVFQCALEACRLLDRAGVLRQAKQESRQNRQRRPANYDSDEDDSFLDRTGAVERKRQRRQQGAHTEPKADTYQSLLAQYQKVQSEALAVERRLQKMEESAQARAEPTADGDELDAFMSRLSQGAFSDRQQKRQLKTELNQLRTEEGRLCRLVNLTRPASLPPLRPPPQAAAAARSPLTGFIGRRKGKVGAASGPAARAGAAAARVTAAEEEEEEDEEEDNVSRPAPPEDTASTPTPAKGAASTPAPVKGAAGRPAPPEDVTGRPTPSEDVAGRPAPPEGATGRPAPVKDATGRPAPVKGATGRPAPPEGVTGRPAPVKGAASRPAPPEDVAGRPAPPDDVAGRPAPVKGAASRPAPSEDVAGRPAPPEGVTGRPAPPEDVAARLAPGPAARPDGQLVPGDNGMDTESACQSAGDAGCRGLTGAQSEPGEPGEPGEERVTAVPPAARSGERDADRTDRVATETAVPAATACGDASPQQHQQVAAETKRKRQSKDRRPKKQAAAAGPYSDRAGDGSYDVWMPPEGQSGDGRTSLNDKLGY